MSSELPATSKMSKLECADPGLLDILKSLLQFNPYMRPSAAELMKHRIFDDVRNMAKEAPSTNKMRLSIDSDDVFDQDSDDFNFTIDEINESLF